MQLIKNLMLCACFGLVLMSCGIQRNCPAFDKEILSWIPYSNGDTVRLVSNNESADITFGIANVEVHHTTHYWSNADCGECDDYITLNDYTIGDNGLRAEIILSDGKVVSETYSVNGVEFDTDYSNYSLHEDYQYGDCCYDLVKVFENNGPGSSFVKLIIAKDYGIVGLVDQNGNEWGANGVDEEQLYQKEVAIVNESCGS